MAFYESVRAWQTAHQLTRRLLEVAAGFPPDERFELTSQLRRSAISVPSNLMEGNARYGVREYRRHVRTALASLAEAGYLIYLAWDQGYLSEQREQDLQREIGALRGILINLARALQRKVDA
jgi:four helix bundle protein